MGFYRTVLSLKRAARFFFYCQNVIQILLAIIEIIICSFSAVDRKWNSLADKLMNTGTIYPHMVKLQMISQDWGI